MILFIAKFWPYIAVVVLGVGLYFSIQETGRQKAIADNAIEIANTNAQIAEQARKDRERADSIIAAYEKKDKGRKQRTNQKLAEIGNAPPDKDGPLASVLRDVLSELPEPTIPTGKNDT